MQSLTDNNPIEIFLSKKKLVKLLVFSILFIGGGLWMLIAHPQTSNPIFNNPIVKYGAAIGGVIMGLFGVYYSIKKMSDKNPGLVINKEGVIDNSSAVSAGLVLWEDITAVKVRYVYRQKYIMLIVKNPEDYINRQTGLLKRKGVASNYKTFGSPIQIVASTLDCKFDELKATLAKRLEEFQTRSIIDGS